MNKLEVRGFSLFWGLIIFSCIYLMTLTFGLQSDFQMLSSTSDYNDESSTYTNKSVSENFISNPLPYIIVAWVTIHILLGWFFCCYMISERSRMKPISISF
ncbi:hypothetical protein cand_018740 [Cryptosporidium andersoni]|uniref:Uncharacterized protein n=1 Tax=Cryptosporidium andersoni TaxID=117008 RepID=A0A1J4MC30_9CRYT|nr:hypothetical protein cand_018740 [Cryptosporidium andersoni]